MPVSAATTTVTNRISALDAVRGVAVLGILLINVDALSGYAFITPAERAALPMSALDEPVWFLLALFIEAKFYSLFSFLFGVSFAIFVQRAAARGDDAVRLFRRRLTGLLLIGLVHTLFIWMGDILVMYALLGFALIPFLKRSDRTILRWALGMLIAPIVIYAFLVVLARFAPASDDQGGLPTFLVDATRKFASGSYLDVVAGNVVFTAANWVRRTLLMFPPRVFGMFLLGLYVGRRGMLSDVAAHRSLFEKVCIIGFSAGFPLSFVAAGLGSDTPGLPGLRSLVVTIAQSISAPAMALAYAAGCAILFARMPRLRDLFAPVGRMALTAYLTHSVVGVIIFYGIGFGLFGRAPLSLVVLGALLFFPIQMAISRIWLARADFGPAEWVWRIFTYRRLFPLFR